MKRTIYLIVVLCMILGVSLVSAAPQPPYILFGHVEWNDQPLSGSRLDMKVNGVPKETIITDGAGYWQSGLSSYYDGVTITLKVLDGCGTNDVCSKTITIGEEGYNDYAEIDFSITGELSCPPTQCPSCGGGGGGGCYYSETVCNDKFPPDDCESCPNLVYTQTKCNTLYPCEETPVEVCEPPIECPEEECPIVPEGLTGGKIIVYIISILGGVGVGIYGGMKLTADRINRIKGVTYRVAIERDGDIREEHRHAGIKSYHSINTIHKDAHERHPKGERYPLYEKDEDGVYNYVSV